MTFDKLIPFGSAGIVESVATFTQTLIARGFLKERLPFARLNACFNRVDTALNHLIDRRVGYLRGTTRDAQILENRYSADALAWAQGSYNRATAGDANSVFSRIYPTVIGGVPSVLAADSQLSTSKSIKVINSDDMTVRSVTLAGLPSGFAGLPVGILADGVYAYVAFSNASIEQRVQCYVMSASSSWAVRTGWPAEGCEINSNSGIWDPVDMCFANSTHIAVGKNYNPSATPIMFINRTTGVIDASGKGDIASPADGAMLLCSNGSYVFYISAGYIGSINPATPTAGCGGTGWPISRYATSLACAGPLVFASDETTTIYVYNTARATYGTITLTGLVTYVGNLCWDGHFLWARCMKTVGSTPRQCLVRIRINGLVPESTSTGGSITIADGIADVFYFDPYIVHPVLASGAFHAMNMNVIGDGRDIWFGGSQGGSTTFSPYVFRIPFSTLR